jgi:putative transposase
MGGRKFRLLNIIDDYNREILAIEADTSFTNSETDTNIRVFKRVQRASPNDKSR